MLTVLIADSPGQGKALFIDHDDNFSQRTYLDVKTDRPSRCEINIVPVLHTLLMHFNFS